LFDLKGDRAWNREQLSFSPKKGFKMKSTIVIACSLLAMSAASVFAEESGDKQNIPQAGETMPENAQMKNQNQKAVKKSETQQPQTQMPDSNQPAAGENH
jgi:hypothetical protein